ncbi:IpaB/EvcA family protein [Limosilactobacillus sp. RRLNB_1_1]|uniref:IpaB/EvcA family protein n=1 Tax=Limosilactobacillus albertensis TaxID=2759752 RepID=A0A7W3TT65_9LACO|nr:IpaB/EvcA family protein [Limosilactobacillus albertensis]MBB1070414.1 IpaB/EvcA family protein [Limosilactobacillus albertensis]MCD7117532.1 IpaB/EvcA family protein [Limosilactobacillus albertensis]MCD7127880.1 IpaB/EvcA family protein [Limosilactobacillus albertensis]
MTEEIIKLNKENQALLDQVNSLYPEGSVFVQFHGDKSGYVRHDQATQQTIPGALVIIVTDLTAPNYTASHELLHLLMLLKGFPQIFFQLSLGEKELDEQMMIMSTDLYNVAMHRVVVAEQRKHGFINDQIEEEYLKGIEHTLTPEKEEDDERTLRLLTLLDALVFYGDNLSKYEKVLEEKYPLALAAAKEIYAEITSKPIKSPFDMRRSIIKIYSLFDQQMQDWGLPALHNNEYTTLSPVLSERQLRLEMRQVFEIYHSDMKERGTDKRAYVGLRRSDGQNSFTLPTPANNAPEEFKKIYDQPVKEFLEQNSVPYIVRK